MFRRRKNRDFSDEIQAHIALEADRLRAEGLSEADARAAARKAFGNLGAAEEHFYESTRWLWWDELGNDLRYAFRTLLHTPGFTAAAVLTLALGIGANTAIFSAIDAVALRPLPYPHPGRIVLLYGREAGGGTSDLSPADFLDFRREMHSFETLAAYRQMASNLTNEDRPERIEGAVVTPDFFAVMGVPAEVGRTLDRSLDQPGTARVVVLSDAFWHRRYGANPAIVGQSIHIDGVPRVVAGVMPPQFQYPPATEVWMPARFAVPEHPLRPDFDQSGVRDTHYFDVIGRMKPEVSRRAAQAEGDLIAKRLKQQYKDVEEAERVDLVPLDQELYGDSRSPLEILLAAVALLLLIASANVASLVLARGATRRKEFAIRAALGAGIPRLVRQFLAESLLLASSGCLLGVALAYVALGAVSSLLPSYAMAATPLQIDWRVLGFAAAVSAASGLLCGFFPAAALAKPGLAAVLNDAARGSSGGVRPNRTRSLLVIGEVALTTVLLIGAGLLIRSFSRLTAEPVGFRPDHVLTARLSLPPARYPDPASRARFVRRMLDSLEELPGVSSAAVVSRLPLLPGNSTRSVDIKGRTSSDSDIAPDYLVASPQYFRGMGIRLLRGRMFTAADGPDAPPVVIVNSAMARRFWPGQDPVGQSVTVGLCGPENQWCTVVGVVEDIHQHDLGESAQPAVYVPYARDPWPFMAVMMRTAAEPAAAATALAGAVHSVDKDQVVYEIRTMRDVVLNSFATRRVRMLFVVSFAVLALALACIGIYGLVAYTVAQRGHEIGIRMALGAGKRDVLRLVIRQGLRLAVAGVAAGLLLAAGLSRLLAAMLYNIRPTDAVSFAGAAILLAAVAALASYIPAWRATKLDPAISLRME
jgi:putative ABC transport system permease protein